MPLNWEAYADPAALSQETREAPDRRAREEGIGPWPYVVSALGDGLDAGTTMAALRRGGREANPVLGSGVGRNLAVKSAGAAGFLLLLRELAKHKPGLAKVLGYGNGIGKGAIAAHNLRNR